MELAYLSDPMTRFNSWTAYPTWEEIDFKEKLSKKTQSNQCAREAKISEKNCSICQKKKKRALSDYIKSKQMDCQNSTCIREEDEEEEGGRVPEGKQDR